MAVPTELFHDLLSNMRLTSHLNSLQCCHFELDFWGSTAQHETTLGILFEPHGQYRNVVRAAALISECHEFSAARAGSVLRLSVPQFRAP